MKRNFTVVETYWKDIEVNAKSEDKAEKLAKEQAKALKLGKERDNDRTIEFTLDVIPEGKPKLWECLHKISEETSVNWYQEMQPWQRKELTQEELFTYAEEMRLALERIFDITYEFELDGYK